MGTHVASESDEIELIRIDNIYTSQNPLLSNDSFDYDDMSSVVHTSRSVSSNNVFNVRSNEVNSRSTYKSIEPTEIEIGTATVKKSSNVTFGSIFNGPVVINSLITDRNDVTNNTNVQYNQKSDAWKTRTEHTSNTSYRITPYYFGSKRRLIFFILASAVVLATGIIAVRYYLHLVDGGVNKDNLRKLPIQNLRATTADYGPNVGDYELIERKQYGALPSKTVIEPLKLPVRRIIIGHTATPTCTDYSVCASRVRQMQNFHMNTMGWDDIAYNFLVGGDGLAYEGRGYKVGAHTKNINRGSLFIAFIGNFTSVEAPNKQLEAAQRLISNGLKMNLIHPDYVLYGQRQIRNIDSPGLKLYNQIILWSHWSKEIISF